MELKNLSSLILITLGIMMIFLGKRIKILTRKIYLYIGIIFILAGILIAGSEFINGFKEGWDYYSK